MNSELKDALKNGGWSPGRSLPTGAWFDLAQEWGQDLFPEAERALSQYLGCLIQLGEVSFEGGALTGNLLIDPLRVRVRRDSLEGLSEVVGERLFCLGILGGSGAYVGESGSLILEDDGQVLRAASDLESGILKLVQGDLGCKPIGEVDRGWRGVDGPPVLPGPCDKTSGQGATDEKGLLDKMLSDESAEDAQILVAGGWYPGRVVRTDAWEALAVEAESTISEVARGFLGSLAGCFVPRIEEGSISTGFGGPAWINPLQRYFWIGYERSCFEDLGIHIDHLGALEGPEVAGVSLYVSNLGEFYAGWTTDFWLVGESVREAITEMIRPTRSPEMIIENGVLKPTRWAEGKGLRGEV